MMSVPGGLSESTDDSRPVARAARNLRSRRGQPIDRGATSEAREVRLAFGLREIFSVFASRRA